jgi:putative glutamine amidotransferase
MDKIKILLAHEQDKPLTYIGALTGVGAEPIHEWPQRYSDEYDGLLLCGGADIDPKYYNEDINGSVDIDAERDTLEFALLKSFVDAGKPIMGVCRGHQLINVYFGGSLYQDIEEAELHKDGKAHLVTAAPDSVLRSLYGETFSVNSIHHQAVKVLGKGLRATAVWNGKYIEATEHTSLPIITVQWHPERMCFAYRRDDTVDGAPIIQYFVEMCRKYK